MVDFVLLTIASFPSAGLADALLAFDLELPNLTSVDAEVMDCAQGDPVAD